MNQEDDPILTAEEQIEAVMRTLDQSVSSTPTAEQTEEDQLLEGHPSPTLGALDSNRRPKVKTVCEACPNSVWFSSPSEVKCYCRVMYLVTWSTKEPNQMTGCDGLYLGQEQ